MGDAGNQVGVHRLSQNQRPHLGNAGRGVHRLSTQKRLASPRCEQVSDSDEPEIYDYFRLLACYG